MLRALLATAVAASGAAAATDSARAASAAAPAPPPTTTVFASYAGAPANCYRQPLLLAPPGALLAIAEGRNLSSGWCSATDYPPVANWPIVAKRSTDGGATWSRGVVIAQGDLDFLVAVVDPATGVTHLHLQVGDAGVLSTTSPDGGLTWTAPAPLAVAGVPPSLVTVIPGVGHGAVVSPAGCLDPSCAGTAGRLVMPWACTVSGPVSNDTACSNCRSCLVLSDDHGATWRLGAVSPQAGSRESALAQLDSADWATLGGVLYAGERNLGNTSGVRLHAVSLDGGRSFAHAGTDAALPDAVTANWTGVVSGLARVAGGRLLFTAPAAPGRRANLTAFASAGVGAAGVAQWRAVGPVWPADAAYSDLIAFNATHAAVLFECGDGANGDFAMYIKFAWLPLAAYASAGSASV